MTGKIHQTFVDFLARLAPRRKARYQGAPYMRRGAIKGNMCNVIVVEQPDGMFSSAVFVLREDYFRAQEISREALLQQAKEAAEEYVRKTLPTDAPRQRGFIRALPLLLVFAALLVSAVLYLM